MRDRLIGTTTLVLSIALDPEESVRARVGSFAWMTDSIRMSTDLGGEKLADSELPMSTYTARGVAGTIALAARRPGSIVTVDIGPGQEMLVHADEFLAGTPAIKVSHGRQFFAAGAFAGTGPAFHRIGGEGRAWVELAGQAVRHELNAGESLRAYPGHVGMFEPTVSLQLTRVHDMANRSPGDDALYFAVVSGPGAVWLQSTPLPAPGEGFLAGRAPGDEGAIPGGCVLPKPAGGGHTGDVSWVGYLVIVLVGMPAAGCAVVGGWRALAWLEERSRKAPPAQPLADLAASLRRLRAELEDTETRAGLTAKHHRVEAIRGAYLDVLTTACRRLDVAPPPGGARATQAGVYRAEAALRERGLAVQERAAAGEKEPR
jgi:uncharacterized protein (AIM24 family)